MTNSSRVSLAEIRRQLDAARSVRTRRELAMELGNDPRRGARMLAQRVFAEEDAQKRERARLSKLLARRRQLHRSGLQFVAGVDEVGVGPLAGPLVAAAVILPRRVDADVFHGLDDSKRLTPAARERLSSAIRDRAIAVSIGTVSAREVDRLNIWHAAREAMRRSVAGLDVPPEHVLVDARMIPRIQAAQTPIVHGDALDASIAAASIVAKVHRDGLMRRLARRHPGYGFEKHVGYGTRQHLDALDRLGPTPSHRRSFAPVARAFRA